MSPIALLGVRYDAGSSFQRGAAEGPAAVRAALWSGASNWWTEGMVDLGRPGVLIDEGDLEGDASDAAALRAALAERIDAILARGDRPLVLGGDHSVTHPVLRGVRRHCPRLTILHFDAHPDLYEEYEGNRFSHACPFARILEEQLADRLVQVGIRTLNGHQRDQASRYGVEVVTMREWDLERVPALEAPVYVSIDLDVFDPAFAPGVSHRESGGLAPRDVLRVLERNAGRIVAADVVELNPRNDPAGITAPLAARLVKQLAEAMLA